MGRFIDLTGETSHRLRVTSQAASINHRIFWNCVCECGSEIAVRGDKLKNNHTRSCGCLQREKAASIGDRTRKHGKKNTPEYKSYSGARARTENIKNRKYASYGGRGIRFMFDSFEQFLSEVGVKPSPAHSLDRIDNNGHYAPGNVRWATPVEQANNRRERSK